MTVRALGDEDVATEAWGGRPELVEGHRSQSSQPGAAAPTRQAARSLARRRRGGGDRGEGPREDARRASACWRATISTSTISPDEPAGARRVDVDDLVALGAPLHAIAREVALLALARPLDEHAAAACPTRLARCARAELLGRARRGARAARSSSPRARRRRAGAPACAGRGEYLKPKSDTKPDLAHERERLREVVLRLAGEARR